MNENVAYLKEAYGVSQEFAMTFEQMRQQWVKDTGCDIDIVTFIHDSESKGAEYLFEAMTLDMHDEYNAMIETFYAGMTPVKNNKDLIEKLKQISQSLSNK